MTCLRYKAYKGQGYTQPRSDSDSHVLIIIGHCRKVSWNLTL